MGKAKNVKNTVRIVATVVGVIFVSSLCVACSLTEKRCQESVQIERRELVHKLNTNSNLVNFLENAVYNYERSTVVTFDMSRKTKIEVKVNNKKKKIEAEQVSKLEEVFKTFNCENISIQVEGSEKIIRMFFGNVNVDESNVYTNSLIYSKSETAEERYGDKICPNWYHETLFYH